MRTLVMAIIVLVMAAPSWGAWTISGLSGTKDNVAGGIGKTFNEGKAEAGFSFLATDTGTDKYRTALGLYGAAQFDVPGIPDLADDVNTFAGFTVLYDTDEHKGIFAPFVGAMMFPERAVSPVAIWRYQIFQGGLQAPEFQEGSQAFVGLQIKFR